MRNTLKVSARCVRRRREQMLLLVGFIGAVWGCSGDTTGLTPLSPSQAYWALRLNYHAVNMATVPPDNTVQLTATPINAAGDLLPSPGSATYKAADSSVSVDSTGLVTARYTTSLTMVIATLQDPKQNKTHVDTVFIQVTQSPPSAALATFSIQPAVGDSAKRSLDYQGGSFVLPVNATDVARDSVCNTSGCSLLVYFTSSNPNIATIDRSTGQVTPQQPGHVTFYATTLAYGVAKRDSLPFIIGYKIFPDIDAQASSASIANLKSVLNFIPSVIVVGAGANITWENTNTQEYSLDIDFDDSSAVRPGCGGIADVLYCQFFPPTGGGNILPFAPDTTFLSNGDNIGYYNSGLRARTFPITGTYHYHSRLNHTGGTVIVVADP